MMRTLTAVLMVALLASAAFAGPGGTPYTGSGVANGFAVTVIDVDIDQTFEVITADTGFTAMTTSDTIRVAYAATSRLDSVRAGSGTGDLVSVFTDGTTDDQTGYNNFLQDRGTGTVDSIAAAWGNGYSPRYNAYMVRLGDSDYNLSSSWAVAVFSKGLSSGNPGVGTVQTIFSLASSVIVSGTQRVDIQYTDDGYITGVITDDGGTSIDSLVYAVDVYDSTWTSVVFSCAASIISLSVNGSVGKTKDISNATSVLALIDDLSMFATPAGENDFRGHMDEIYVENGRHWLTPEMGEFIYERYLAVDGNSTDTSLVRIVGMSSGDSLTASRLCTVVVDAAAKTPVPYAVFTNSYLEQAGDHPIMVYTNAASPRSAKLDSIPADLIHYPTAQLIFGKGDTPILQKVIYENYGANAITYQLRVYHNVYGVIDFNSDYEIKCPSYIASGGGQSVFDFGEMGLYLGPNSAIVAFAKGAAANAKGSVTLVGQRRYRR